MMQLLKTKTFWIGLATVATAVGFYVGGEIPLMETIESVLIGLAMITGRHAVSKLKE